MSADAKTHFSVAKAYSSVDLRWRMSEPLPNWDDDAACRGRFDLDWTPPQRPTNAAVAGMTAICDTCPVWRECAKYALGRDDIGGVYAGMYIPWRTFTRDGKALWARTRDKLLNKLLADMEETDD